MTQDETGRNHVPDEARLRELAASIDEAADDLDANGPVPPDELRRKLRALEAEWADDKSSPPRPQRQAVPSPH